jgi:hypothetical protein
MSAAERQLNPSDFSDETVRSLALAIVPHLKSLATDQAMTIKETATFLKCSRFKIHSLVSKGRLKARRMDENSRPLFLLSDVIQFLKNS